jgi:glycosyltransferase involved in cell wall biosynthesis
VYKPVFSDPTHAQISVIVPAYNQGPALKDTVADITATFADASILAEIIVIDDGSIDDSTDLVPSPRLTLLRGPNAGKGAALTAGFNAASSPVLAFIDGDGAYPASSLLAMYRVVKSQHAQIVVGTRRPPRTFRGLLSRVFSLWTRIWLGLNFDTQAGAKVLTADAWYQVRDDITSTRFSFDVDMLFLAKKHGISHPASIGVTPRDITSSTVTVKRFIEALLEVAMLRFRKRTR